MPPRLNTLPCVYCGKTPAGTVDHVPPKKFFPAPRPSNLVTVPACSDCNGGAGFDQDFFLAVFMFSVAGESATGQAIWNQGLWRMYARTRGLAGEIRKRMSQRDFFTPTGLFTGRHFAIEVDHERLSKFVKHTVRGLYWAEFGDALPSDAEVTCLWIDTPDKGKAMDDALQQVPFGRRQWKDIFEYRAARIPDAPARSLWAIRFFGKIVYSAWTSHSTTDATAP